MFININISPACLNWKKNRKEGINSIGVKLGTNIRTKRLELLRNHFHFCLRKDWLPISACSLFLFEVFPFISFYFVLFLFFFFSISLFLFSEKKRRKSWMTEYYFIVSTKSKVKLFFLLLIISKFILCNCWKKIYQ